MRVCVRCDGVVESPDFRCPACGWTPDAKAGIPVLAPELEADLGDYPADYFDELKELEAGHFWFENRNRLVQWALARFFPEAGSFFELGCGTGFVLEGIRERFPHLRLIGGDAATAGLVHARSRVPAAEFLQVDGRRTPFRGEVDVIGAFDVLEHIEDDAAVLREIHRGLRPGGGTIITVPQHRFLWSAQDDHARHKRRYSRHELVTRVQAAGFQVVWATSFVSLLLPVMAAVRLRKRTAQGEPFDPSAEFRISPAVNRVLAVVLGAEQGLIRRGVRMPAGGSLLLVARRA